MTLRAPSQMQPRTMFPSSVESYFPDKKDFLPQFPFSDHRQGVALPNQDHHTFRKQSIMNWSTRSTSDSNTISSRSLSRDDYHLPSTQQDGQVNANRRSTKKPAKSTRMQIQKHPTQGAGHPKAQPNRPRNPPMPAGKPEESQHLCSGGPGDPAHAVIGDDTNPPTNQQQQTNTYQVKFKTELCKNFELQGSCKWGDSCCYAHGKAELRSKTHLNPNYKSKICKHFHGPTGYCPYGLR